MLFSGNNFRLTPETNELKFVFDNFYLDTQTGVAEIGISGSGNVLKFLLKNNSVYAPNGIKVYSYNVNEPFVISGLVSTGSYQYYINQNLIASSVAKNNFTINRFFVNTTGCNLFSNVSLYSNPISTDISINTTFKALSGVSGSVSNNSNNKVRVFNSSLFFYNSYQNVPLLSGNITGDVNANSVLNFGLSDVDSGRFDGTINMLVSLDTSVGLIDKLFSINRASGLSDIVKTLIANGEDLTLPVLFFGSGLSNSFVYIPPTNDGDYLTYSSFAKNLSGLSQPQTLTFTFGPASGTGNITYKSEYVTGIQITATGQYMFIPSVQFTGYYYVTGLNWSPANLLLGSGCSGNIPVYFTSQDSYGTGASGYIPVQKVKLSGVYIAGQNDFYIPASDFVLYSGGTGYTLPPIAHLNTGIYSNCYDAPLKFGSNVGSYKPFNFSGAVSPLASYLTGEVMWATGTVNGNQTGYYITGIQITNDGSGYNAIYFPKFSFVRQTGDSLTQNASGIALMKLSGIYTFANHWSIKTGVSSVALSQFTGAVLPYSGNVNLGAEQNFITVQINYSGLDNTEPVVSKFTIINQDGTSVSNLISGVKTFDITTGFLKKKNIDNLIFFQPQNDLTFLITQNDLDSLYSSAAYSSNQTFEIGDLDF